MRITDKYIFFYGYKDIFSQWYKCRFTIDNIEYNCTEQYMMYQKALLFGDNEIANKILETNDQKKQKMLGRKVKNFDENIWKDECINIVVNGNYYKFSQNKELKDILLKYRNKDFVEASPTDKIWGVGLAENNKLIDDPTNWKGKNLLGKALNIVQKKLLDENIN